MIPANGKNKTEKIILGIDPGTNVMGYGVIKAIGNKAEMVAMGVIDLRKISDPYLRLGKISERAGHHRLLSARRDGYRSTFLWQECAVDAKAGQSAGRGYSCRHTPLGAHS